MAADPAWKGELLEELAQSTLILAFVRIDLGVCPFAITSPQYAGVPCPGPARKIISRSSALISRLS
jgi:hypothetical protein